jgi:hypothetical protein
MVGRLYPGRFHQIRAGFEIRKNHRTVATEGTEDVLNRNQWFAARLWILSAKT